MSFLWLAAPFLAVPTLLLRQRLDRPLAPRPGSLLVRRGQRLCPLPRGCDGDM
jgi:hypothetical protein